MHKENFFLSPKLPPRKVMVIGLDGLTLRLLLPFAQSGKLPTFSRLLEKGAYGELRSVTNMTTGPTWASFATGCEPHQHGILHDFHHQHGAYSLVPTRGADRRVPAFWELASQAGLRAIVLNVPHTYPARPFNGVLLAGIDAPSERADGFDFPPGIFQTMLKQTGHYQIDSGLASYMQAGKLQDGMRAIERETEGRTRAAEYFMQNEAWDLLAVVYSLPDVWQHYYWGSFEDDSDSKGQEIILSGYRLMDEHLGRLLKYLPEDGIVVICSDHGFGPLLSTRGEVNRWLEAQGWLNFQANPGHSQLKRLRNFALTLARRTVGFRARQQLLAAFPALRKRVETSLRIGEIDWASTNIYAALDHQELWVNLLGRQPLGCIKPEEYDAFLDQVTERLLSWQTECSQNPRVKAVIRRPYQGLERGDILPPDLLIEWNTGVKAPQNLHPLVTGDHTPDGTLLLSGTSVCPQKLADCSLTDVAAITLNALGVEVPEFIDGRCPDGLWIEPRGI